jgi:hypothetical protein
MISLFFSYNIYFFNTLPSCGWREAFRLANAIDAAPRSLSMAKMNLQNHGNRVRYRNVWLVEPEAKAGSS